MFVGVKVIVKVNDVGMFNAFDDVGFLYNHLSFLFV